MAELDIGKHCSVESCKQLDFLPFKCDGCGKIFCKDHQVRDRHNCTRVLQPTIERSTTVPYTTYKCSLSDCDKTELVPVPCDKCHHNFCMLHRHSVDHNCTGIEVKPKYMSATAEHVQKIIDSKQADGSAPVKQRKLKSKKQQEMAAKVTLMKLKQTASGDNGVPQETRVYLSVQLPLTDNTQPKYTAFWLDKNWTVGRAVDYISEKAKVKNENNKSDRPKLRLRTTNDESLLDMECKFVQLLTDCVIYNGSTVELCYIEASTAS